MVSRRIFMEVSSAATVRVVQLVFAGAVSHFLFPVLCFGNCIEELHGGIVNQNSTSRINLASTETLSFR